MQPLSPSLSPQDAPAGPRTLFCCLSAPSFYPRPLFSAQEIFCGPDCADEVEGGRVTALRTPAGNFDMAAVVARLPAAQRPDLVVVKADATRRNLARNLDRVPGTKVLLVGDTHHMAAPVDTLLRYAASEPFDAIVVDHTRHHAHFFLEAGFERVYWVPSVDYALRFRPVPEKSTRPLTFVGQISVHHPWRRHVMTRVLQAGLPLETLRGSPEEAADIYAQSAVTLNCSLNADVNLRVFEALGAGGFLMTDALPAESGLERLFTPGRHLVTYRSPDELVELIRHYLDHPAEAMAIRRAGQRHLLDTQSPAIKRRQFLDAVLDGRTAPELDLRDERRGLRPLPPLGPAFRRRVSAYEAVQALHRTAGRVELLVQDGDPLELGATCRDLPRVVPLDLEKESSGAPPAGPDAVMVERALAIAWEDGCAGTVDRLLTRFTGDAVIAATLSGPAAAEAEAHLAGWGLARTEPGGALFRCTDPLRFVARALVATDPERDPAAHLHARLGRRLAAAEPSLRSPERSKEAARLAQTIGDAGLLERFLQRTLAQDRHDDEAMRVLSSLAERSGRPVEAFLLANERHRIAALMGRTAEGGPDPDRLAGKVAGEGRVEAYRAVVRQEASARPAFPGGRSLRILVATNLFPPQEFGGYGRKLWEFSAELVRRGHDVRILTADVPELARSGMVGTADIEDRVERRLALYGRWEGGRAHLLDDQEQCVAIARANAELVLERAAALGSEVCLAGNMDLIGHPFLSPLAARGVPVLHCLGNRHPGYAQAQTPRSPLYRPGPASHWVAGQLDEAGFGFPDQSVIYPGARVDGFYRAVMPAFDRLRIAFASLFVNYKGADTLMNALAVLHASGIEFDCAIAGETPDATLLDAARDLCRRTGMADKVRFLGFQDRRGMAALFARSNVLAFPSFFQEPFGISQVEAMAAGLTVVTSGTGGSREIVRDGVDGLVFTPGDHQDLAAKLSGLVGDRSRWMRLALAGRERAAEFTVARSVDRIEEVFAELLGRRDDLLSRKEKGK
ncbi:glycosyltransferase (plasmid) [Azospirillum sp. 412522]|nr:glycosyltransferase [Azospirillum sp. 412522]MBY6266501.1 glycosyltransferase [Azospirillum sp. 412522]